MRSLLTVFLILVSVSTIAVAQSGATKVEGQIVCCADCWAEADRTTVEYGTAEDLLKAQSCIANGDPTLIAVREGDKFRLYQLNPGKFKLPGKNWLEFVGKRVAVTGAVRETKDGPVIRVDALEELAPSIAQRDAAKIIGSEVELALKDLYGAEQRLSSFKGRIVILNFWATYCVPCRKEMPDLAAIQNEYAALGIQVVGASTDAAEDRAKVLQFVKETKVNFPIWMGATTADMMRFGLGGALPGTVIIGRDGRVTNVISGIINPAELKKHIDTMLASAETTAAVESRTKKGKQVASAKPKPSEVSTVPS